MVRLTLSPTERDRESTHLPPALASLYVLVRPFRLLQEYGLGIRRRLKLDLAVYAPTPQGIIDGMLRLANIGPGDVLYDLGCGDGRIVVTAAEKYGIRAVGVNINPRRIAESHLNARKHGVESRVQFLKADAKKVKLSEATVVMIYLSADANLRLVERLRSELSPGARIRSVALIQPMISPDERANPRLSASYIPLSGSLVHSLKCRSSFRIISCVPSVEPPSMMKYSRFGYCWDLTDWIACSM
jgi:SAM-dependent methyltransferase